MEEEIETGNKMDNDGIHSVTCGRAKMMFMSI
jgi:hypothetical protein